MSEVVVATVESVVGTVIARDADGYTRVLQPGDEIFYGEEVIAEDGAFIEMAFEDGSTMTLAGNESATITDDLAESADPAPEEGEIADATVGEIIAALDRGEDITDIIEAPAAGADGGAAGEGGGFVRIARSSEEVGQITYAYDSNTLRGPGAGDGGGEGATAVGEATLVDSGAIADEGAPEPSLGITVSPLSELVSRVGSDIRSQNLDSTAALSQPADVAPSEQPGTGMVVFTLDAALDLDGLPESAAGPVEYEIVGGDSDSLAIGTDPDGNPAIVLTEQGAWALQNGQVPNNEFSVDVQGTVEIEGIGTVSATESASVAVEVPEPTFDFALWPGEVFPMAQQDELPGDEGSGLQALGEVVNAPLPGDFGFPSSEVEAGMLVFWISPQPDFDGIDPSLGEFSYEIVGGDTEYLELSQGQFGAWSVVLTAEGAEAIQNGQVSGNDLNVTIEGTLIVGESLVNTFMLETFAEGGVLVPVPNPALTVELSAVGTPEGWPQDAEAGQVVFEVTTDLDLDGIDGDLAGEIALLLTEDSSGYLALDGNNVVLTADGAEAIRNGQVSGSELAAAVEGTVTIAEDGVIPFVLSDDAQAGMEVPMPEPSLEVTVTAALDLESSDQASQGQLAFTLSSETDYAGIDPELGGDVSYAITAGNDEGYFALNDAGDAIVLTDVGAQAIRNGQFDPAGASVTVTGTQDVGAFTLTGMDGAGLEEVPVPDPQLTVGLELAEGATEGWPQGAETGQVVFKVTTDLDLDGIDGDLAGEIALLLTEDSSGYLALDGNNVVLTADGAEAIRNGQVSGSELAAAVEGTVTIAEGGVNPFVLSDDAQAGIEVPLPEPSLEVTVTDALELESSDQVSEGQLAFTLSSETDYAGIDPALGGDVSYAITGGNEEGYFELNEAGDAVVLTEAGAQAIRNGQFDLVGANVTVTGTQVIGEGEANSFTVTGVDDASVEVPMPEPELTVNLSAADTPDGWPQSADAGDVVFEVITDLYLDGIDGDLASDIALSLTEDSNGYLALDGNNVVLTEDGAAAIRNGQVSGSELAAAVEGTATIAEDGVNPFVLSDQASAVVGVPVPGPKITGLSEKDFFFDEKHLENGTSPDPAQLVKSGSFALNAPAGIASLAIAGTLAGDGATGATEQNGSVVLTLGQLEALGESNSVEIETHNGNLLTLNGFDSDTGQVSFDLEFREPIEHPEGQDRNQDWKDAIAVALTDANGQLADDTIDVLIRDDVPVFEGGEGVTLSGSVTDSPVEGNNGLNIGADIDGAFINGIELSVNDDGHLVALLDGEEVLLTSRGDKLTSSFDVDTATLTAFNANEDPVFTIQAGIEGRYTINVLEPLDPVARSSFNEESLTSGGGIDDDLFVFDNGLAVQFASDNGAVNWSGSGIGVANNLISGGQTLSASFNQYVTDLDFTMGNQGTPSWEIYRDGDLVGSGNSLSINEPGGFDEIRFLGASGGNQYNIKGMSGTYMDASEIFELPVTFHAEDGDGDPASHEIPITFDPALVDLPEAEPLLIPSVSVAVDSEEGQETVLKDDFADLGVGGSGDGNINDPHPPADTESLMFDFGQANAGQTLNLSWTQQAKGGWEDGNPDGLPPSENRGGTRDTFKVFVNGEELYETSWYDPTNSDGTVFPAEDESLTVTLDENGQAEVVFEVRSTHPDEVVDVSNIQGQLDVTSTIYNVSLEGSIDDPGEIDYYQLEVQGGELLVNGNVQMAVDSLYTVDPADIDGLTVRPEDGAEEFEVSAQVISTDGVWSDVDVNSTEVGDPSAVTAVDNVNTAYVGESPEAATGNVITDEDAEGNTDVPGSDATTLSIFAGNEFVEVSGEHSVSGSFGDLTISDDGTYTYTATNEVANAGSIETFDYKLTHPNGDEAVATLSIRIDSPDVEVIWGDDLELGATIAGTEEDEILVGTSGADQIAAGAGNDILIGGDGADTFIWPGDVAGDVPSIGPGNSGDDFDPDEMPQDVVRDFTVDWEQGFTGKGEADRLDLSDLLVGADSDNVDEYILAEEDGDGNTVLYVRTEGDISPGNSGNSSGADWAHNQSIVLEGVSMDGQSSGEFVKQLMENDQLKIDQ